MKKICITLGVLFIIILAAGCDGTAFKTKGTSETEYLRIHIRANSDGERDQSVKYEIRDALVSALTPEIAKCRTKEDALKVIERSKELLEKTADGILLKKGFSYGAKVTVKNEEFPTRVYDEVTLPGGYYDAVIVELGEAAGNNWWCVVYPPLCFSGGEDVKYASKIAEIIEEFFKKKGG